MSTPTLTDLKTLNVAGKKGPFVRGAVRTIVLTTMDVAYTTGPYVSNPSGDAQLKSRGAAGCVF